MDAARADVHRVLSLEPPGAGAIAGLRVALVAPGELWGGVEQFVETLSGHLITLGVPVVVVVLFDGPLRTRLEQRGIPVTVVGGAGRYDPRALSRMVSVLRSHNATVVHTHGYKATILGAMAAKLMGARIVRTEHGRLEPAAGVERLKMGFNERLETLASRYGADAVVFVSRDVQRHSPSVRSAATQRVVYNGIEPITIPDRASPLEGWDDRAGRFNVGIVGRIVPVKGHVHLLQAIRDLRGVLDVRLYVFGDGPLEAECRNVCDEAGIADLVRFMGFRSNVREYLGRLDLLAMPSLHEGLPYTLLEAMSLKVPVVASRVGGLAEVIEDEVTGILVPPANAPALTRSIERLYGDSGLRSSLSENAFRTIGERFLVGAMAASYLDVYRTVLEARGRS